MTDLDIIKELSREVYSDPDILKEIGSMSHRNYRGYSTSCDNVVTGISLQKLNLTHFPSSIFKLKNLTLLFLEDNQIREIPTIISKLEVIKIIDLSNNNIKVIPAEINKLKFLSSFHFGGNPIKFPSPEVISGGLSRIKDYFTSISKNEVVLREAKLLIVGQGGVGKTSLKRKLLSEKFNENLDSTDGIEIDSWKTIINKKNFRINIWDFGGQEIYHSTHQFFLTKRSFYILLWDARGEDDILSFDYWLNITSLLSNKSPIIIVQNKIDQREKLIDENSFRLSFPNICGFQRISIKKNIGIEQLENLIKREIVKLDHIEDKLPKVWLNIREKLESLNRNYINRKEYIDIATEFGLSEDESINLCGYYHDLGVVLFFRENEILRDRVFLKPNWATNAVYKLLSSNEIIIQRGEFVFEDLYNIWLNYSQDDFIHFIELMKKFELCFKLHNSYKYIIPELLPSSRPIFEWDNKDSTMLIFQYKFMPAGIITRLIVKLNDLIYSRMFWKNGVVLVWNQTRSLITAEPFKKEIKIELVGNNKSELLEIIRREIYNIHKTLNNPSVFELVPCTCKECNEGDSFLFNYEMLKNAYNKNIDFIMCQKSFENQSILNILGKIQPKYLDPKQHIQNFTQYITKNETNMKIQEIKIQESQVIFSERIKKINYRKELKLSEKDFTLLKDGVASLSENKRSELLKMLNETENEEEPILKQSKIEKIKSCLLSWGVAIGQNLAASYIFEGLKMLPI